MKAQGFNKIFMSREDLKNILSDFENKKELIKLDLEFLNGLHIVILK